MNKKIHVLMVCLGNICRSPTAEGIFRSRVEAAGLNEKISVESAGTSDWHVGEAPDPRTIQAAAARHYDLSTQRARQVADEDFSRFDYILAMDTRNLAYLRERCPQQHQHKLKLFLEFSKTGKREVPDPYSGGASGFELVLDLVEETCDGLLQTLVHEHRLLN